MQETEYEPVQVHCIFACGPSEVPTEFLTGLGLGDVSRPYMDGRSRFVLENPSKIRSMYVCTLKELIAVHQLQGPEYHCLVTTDFNTRVDSICTINFFEFPKQGGPYCAKLIAPI